MAFDNAKVILRQLQRCKMVLSQNTARTIEPMHDNISLKVAYDLSLMLVHINWPLMRRSHSINIV